MKVLAFKGNKAHAILVEDGSVLVSKELMRELKTIQVDKCPPEYAPIMLSGRKIKAGNYLPIEVSQKEIKNED